MPSTPQGNKISILLNEYQACQASIDGLEATVWQSATLLGAASVATLALVASKDTSIAVVAVIAVLSTVGALAWWRLANRWWSILHAKLERMRHIEEDLKAPGQTHYIRFLDDLHENRSSRPVAQGDSRITSLAKVHGIRVDRARRLAALEYERKGPKDVLRILPWLTATAWVIYLVLRIVAPVWHGLRVLFFFVPITRWFIPGA